MNSVPEKKVLAAESHFINSLLPQTEKSAFLFHRTVKKSHCPGSCFRHEHITWAELGFLPRFDRDSESLLSELYMTLPQKLLD